MALRPNEFKLTRTVDNQGVIPPSVILYAGWWKEQFGVTGIYFRCDEPGSGRSSRSRGPYQLTNGTVVRSASGFDTSGPFTPDEIAQMFDQTMGELPPPTGQVEASPSAR